MSNPTFYLFSVLPSGKVLEGEVEYTAGDYAAFSTLYSGNPAGESLTEAELPATAKEIDALIRQQGGAEFAAFCKGIEENEDSSQEEAGYDEALWQSLGARESHYEQAKLDYFR